MSTTSDRWSCPFCPTTVVCGVTEPLAVWLDRLGRAQLAHARICKGAVLPR